MSDLERACCDAAAAYRDAVCIDPPACSPASDSDSLHLPGCPVGIAENALMLATDAARPTTSKATGVLLALDTDEARELYDLLRKRLGSPSGLVGTLALVTVRIGTILRAR